MIKHLASLALALTMVAGAGCGGSQKSGGGGAAKQSCATAAANAGAQLRAAAGAAGDAETAQFVEQGAALIEKVMGERCAADAWSAEAIDCVATADDKTMDVCTEKLTQAQRDAMAAQMEQETSSLAPDGPPVAPDNPCGE